MINFQRTILLPFTLRQLIFGIFTYMVSFALPSMTWFAEMSITPTKPLSNRTAKLTFKFNKVLSMSFFWTIRFRANTTASRANKMLLFELFVVFHFSHHSTALFCTTKIRMFAFKASIIWVDGHCIFKRLFIVRIFWVLKSFIFVSVFMF